MIERLTRTKRNVALAILLVLLGWFAWSIRSVLNPVLLGYLCAYILHPFVLRIERLGFSRRVAVNMTFVAGLLASLVIGLLLVLQVRSLTLEVYHSARSVTDPDQVEAPLEPAQAGEEAPRPDFAQRLELRLEEFRARLEGWGIEGLPEPHVSLEGLREGARELLGKLDEDATSMGLNAAERGIAFMSRFVSRVVSLAGMFVLLPLYAYYFLFVQKDMHGFVQRYLPKRDRERMVRTAGAIGEVISSFFRGRLGVSFIKGLILSAGLWIADVDYAFLFGMGSGFLSVIPFFGPFIGFVLAGLVATLDHGVLSALLRTGIVFGLAEMLEGYVLVPRVLGDSLGLHPLVVFVALLAGGAALGMLGVLLALPLTASCVILMKEFVLPALREFADEDPAVP